MGKFKQLCSRVWAFLSGAATLWPIIPSGIVAVIGGYLSAGVAWINQTGAWGWFSVGLGTFLITYILFAVGSALLAKAKVWRLDAKQRELIIGEGSPFDPMARVYENKRLYLRDLAPAGRRQVSGKKFINCEIIGPGTAMLGLRTSEDRPFPKMEKCNTIDVDCIEYDPNTVSFLSIRFFDCDFEFCTFYHMTLLFTTRDNETLNWITPDSRQAPLQLDSPDRPDQPSGE